MTLKSLGLVLLAAFGLLIVLRGNFSSGTAGIGGDGGVGGNCYADVEGPSTPTLCQ